MLTYPLIFAFYSSFLPSLPQATFELGLKSPLIKYAAAWKDMRAKKKQLRAEQAVSLVS